MHYELLLAEQLLRKHVRNSKDYVTYCAVPVSADTDAGSLCERLWDAVLTLLRVLLQQGGQEALHQLTPVLTRHWSSTAGRSPSTFHLQLSK